MLLGDGALSRYSCVAAADSSSMQLRPYQQQAITRTLQCWDQYDRLPGVAGDRQRQNRNRRRSFRSVTQSPSRAKEPNQPRRSDRNPRTKCGTLQAVTKEVVGIHVLLTRSLFGDGILHRFLLRVSLTKPTFAEDFCSIKFLSQPSHRNFG